MDGGNSAYRQTGTLTYGHSGSDVLHIHDPTACYTMEVTAGTYENEVSWSNANRETKISEFSPLPNFDEATSDAENNDNTACNQ